MQYRGSEEGAREEEGMFAHVCFSDLVRVLAKGGQVLHRLDFLGAYPPRLHFFELPASKVQIKRMFTHTHGGACTSENDTGTRVEHRDKNTLSDTQTQRSRGRNIRSASPLFRTFAL